MNRITIDPEALHHNLEVIRERVADHGARMTVVTKALCGNADAVRALAELGVRSMADSRLENFAPIQALERDIETWYLRPPHLSALPDVVAAADVSLNTELATITALNEEARRQDRCHGVVIMIELGDLREGILPGTLVRVYEEVFELSHISVLGIGSNLGCLSGAVPSLDQFMQLVLYKELLELKFKRELPLISAGTSAVLPLLGEGRLPRQINHFRIGESIFLGSDLVHGEVLYGLRDDAVVLEAEVVEIKEKALVAAVETGEVAPFEQPDEGEEPEPGSRGYRAVVAVGHLDTDIGALTPVNPGHHIAGASSDLTVVNIGPEANGLRVGGHIGFRMGYSAFVRAMSNRYTEQRVLPLEPDPGAARAQLAPRVAAGQAVPDRLHVHAS